MDQNETNNQLNIRDILSILRRRKWFIIISFFLSTIASFAGSYLIKPSYESSVIIQINEEVELIGDIRILLGQQPGYINQPNRRRERQQSILNQVTSLNYIRQLNDKLHLDQQPAIEKKAQQYVAMQPIVSIESARLRVIQEQLKDGISVFWVGADQIKITAQAGDPAQAKDIATTLGNIYIEEKIKQDLDKIRSSQDFSDVQLEKYEQQVKEKIADATKVEQQLLKLHAGELTPEIDLSEINSEIDQTNSDISDLRSGEREILKSLGNIESLNRNKLKLTTVDFKKSIKQKLESRLRQIGDLLSKYSWRDRQVINFRLKENELLTQSDSTNQLLVAKQFSDQSPEVKKQLTNLFNNRDRLNYLYAKKPYLEAVLTDLDPSTVNIPELQARADQLNREVQVATDIRDRFRRQQESSTISQALLEDQSSTKYRQVETATLAIEPVAPDRIRVTLMGMLLGIAIGIGAIFLVELMDTSFKRVEDVESKLGIQVLAITPKIDFIKQIKR